MQWLIETMLENEVEQTSNLYHRIYYLHYYISLVSDVMKLELIVFFILTSESIKSVRFLCTQLLTLLITMISFEINKMKNCQMIFFFVIILHKNRNDPSRFVIEMN